jgi:addiction module RelE/StbE family toxin
MKVSFHRNFDKNYGKLSLNVRNQFKKRLKLFLKDTFHPLLNDHALHGKWQHFRSINVNGDVRAFYCQTSDATVEFVIIDTHSNLYK